MPQLDQIWIFPIKSLDGVSVQSATITPTGALLGDREFAIVDRSGHWINGKRTAKVHSIRATYDLPNRMVTLSAPNFPEVTLDLDGDRPQLEGWLSDYFGEAVQLIQNSTGGFPDDTDSPGPTVISTATLATIADWFDLDLAETRSRFRTNLELSHTEPFWEDQLYGNSSEWIPFQIGEVTFRGVNPCQRCIVPTRNTRSGDATAHFRKHFSQKRQETLPPWVNRDRFNHYYRLAVNTRLDRSEVGKSLTVGHPCRRT